MSGNGTAGVHEALVKEIGLSWKLSLYVEMKQSAAGVRTSTSQLAPGRTPKDFFGASGEF